MAKIEDHINLLGLDVTDKITGFTGIVTSVCFDLYGCIQATIHPGLDKEGKIRDCHWFDISRLRIDTIKPVMDRPDFTLLPLADGGKGPADKPTFFKS